MHSKRQIGFEPALISSRAENGSQQTNPDFATPRIVIQLKDIGDRSRAADIVIDRFPFVIGRRHDCDLALNSPSISRRHCCFLRNGEEIRLQDLKSTNGTYLNGNRVNASEILREGDVITLDSFSFRLCFALVNNK
jgi:pSer/pThr/pTyr-binding forkhead associated (FHA) protein